MTSRRELYARELPFGESCTRRIGGRIVFGDGSSGGGGSSSGGDSSGGMGSNTGIGGFSFGGFGPGGHSDSSSASLGSGISAASPLGGISFAGADASTGPSVSAPADGGTGIGGPSSGGTGIQGSISGLGSYSAPNAGITNAMDGGLFGTGLFQSGLANDPSTTGFADASGRAQMASQAPISGLQTAANVGKLVTMAMNPLGAAKAALVSSVLSGVNSVASNYAANNPGSPLSSAITTAQNAMGAYGAAKGMLGIGGTVLGATPHAMAGSLPAALALGSALSAAPRAANAFASNMAALGATAPSGDASGLAGGSPFSSGGNGDISQQYVGAPSSGSMPQLQPLTPQRLYAPRPANAQGSGMMTAQGPQKLYAPKPLGA